jgi:hypothetical protein
VTAEQFWRLHPDEFWLWFEANKPEPVYGKKYQLTGTEADEILKDLRKHGKRYRRRAPHRAEHERRGIPAQR